MRSQTSCRDPGMITTVQDYSITATHKTGRFVTLQISFKTLCDPMGTLSITLLAYESTFWMLAIHDDIV